VEARGRREAVPVHYLSLRKLEKETGNVHVHRARLVAKGFL
jgi:hypothetical protein